MHELLALTSPMKCIAGTLYRFTFIYLHITLSNTTGQPLTQSAQTDGEGVNNAHKQVKLHGLLLNFINFTDPLEDTIDYPKRGHKKGRREGRGHREGLEALAQLLTLMLAPPLEDYQMAGYPIEISTIDC